MDIMTLIEDYLSFYNVNYDDYGKSFVSKSQSGYYFPCRYAFYEYRSEPSFGYYLSFVKGMEYKNGEVGCSATDISIEDPSFDTNIITDDYIYAAAPFQNWQHRMFQ